MTELTLRVNGRPVSLDVAPSTMLVEVLRDRLGLTGAKVGCGEGGCGACTVLLDGQPVASCITPAIKAHGRDLVTIEGVQGAAGGLHPIQEAFLAEGAVQCGFCTPGLVLTTKALLDRNPEPTEDEIRVALTGHLCRCTGYNSIVAAVRRAATALRQGTDIVLDRGAEGDAVGAPVVRKDGVAKVTGRQRYGADLQPGAGFTTEATEGTEGTETAQVAPSMRPFSTPSAFSAVSAPSALTVPVPVPALHAAALFSEQPYAEVVSLDVGQARAMPGVAAVLTAADVPGRNAQGIIIPHQPIFVPVGGRVRCVGDILALAVAESEKEARSAVARIGVQYRPLTGVFSPPEALAPDAPILHAGRPGDPPSNVMYGTHVEKGKPDEALAGADVVVEGTFRTPFGEHAYLEPEAGAAAVDPDGVVTVWMASQAVGFHQRLVAEVLGLPAERVRMVHVTPGGAFGARNDMSLHPYLALAAYHTRRPVKMALSRAESLRYHSKRHAMEHTLRLGASRDGRLVALTCDILADTGAYSSAGIPVLDQATLFATGPYEIPNVRIKGLSVYTNNVPAGAMRGFGIPESAFAIESLMDELAQALGMSPFELRRINGLRPGSTTATGQVLDHSVPFLETLRLAEEVVGEALAGLSAPAPGIQRGVGVGCCYKNVGLGLGLPESAGAGMELTAGGRVLVRTGGAELGQGSDTVMAQLTSQALGLPFALVDVCSADTACTPDGGITSASRTTFMSGNAVLKAAALFRESIQAEMPAGARLTAEALANLAQRLAAQGRRLRVEATYEPPPTFGLEATGPEQRVNFAAFSYATQAAIVDVDEETGHVDVRRIVAVHDIGRVINPQGARGQVEGSCLMGLGYALTEEFMLDKGRLVTGTLNSILVPTFQDAPPIDVIFVEDPDPAGPYGAKGMAEAAAIPTAPAIINAIQKATGARVRQLPATAERVLVARERCA